MFSGQRYFQTLICCENHYCQVLDAQLWNMSFDSLEWQVSDSGGIYQKRMYFQFWSTFTVN